MNLRHYLPVGLVLVLIVSGSVSAATIEISDGSVIVGDIIDKSEQSYTIRMKNGAELVVRACDVIHIRRNGKEEPLERAPENGILRFSGSNTVGEQLVPTLAKSFVMSKGANDTHWTSEKNNERTLKVEGAAGCIPKEIIVKAHGSSTAFVDLEAGQADIGMSSRPIKPEEVNALIALGDLTGPESEHILALDGVAVIVHPDNPLHTLTIHQLAEIFAGEISDWSTLGSEPGRIQIYARDDKSGTYDTFNTLVLKREGRSLSPEAQRFESSIKLSDNVASDPRGIGFIGLAYIRRTKALKINECGLLYPPTPFTAKTEEYPLARRLFLYTPTNPPSFYANDFIKFALSDAGQEITRKIGFVDLSIDAAVEASTTDTQLARLKSSISNVQNVQILRDFVDISTGATRLSVTFRFKTGTADLDNRALRDIKRLAAYMKSDQGQGKQLMLLGFADATGAYANNLVLSEARARVVAKQLAWSGARPTVIRGFGQEAPVACNDNRLGQDKNRRVEVWLKPGAAQ
jgi:phosphate transport system substrate-binding protein